MVGLLGTVLGMATTFRAFMEGGQYATAQALSTGMWQALITAGTALALAIPAHLGHHLLSGRVRAIVRDVEWAGNEIMRYLLIEYKEQPPASGGTAKGAGGTAAGNGGHEQ
jgi:biopolymer transport protein ExbB